MPKGEVASPDANSAPVPEVTVLMAVYNGGPLLAQAVDSILAQSFTDFEFLIVDDGSTDGAVDALHAIADARLRFVRNPRNLGLTVALNLGLGLARAPLIARMDADDVSMPNRLQRQVETFRLRPSLGLLGSWAEIIDVFGRFAGQIQLPVKHEDIARAILRDNVFVHPSVMVRADVLREIGGYPVEFSVAQDYAMWVRIVLRHEVANLPETLVKYRIHSDQVSHRHLRKQRVAARKIQSWGRREYVSEGVVDSRALPPEPSFWGDLTASSGTLGNDYKQLARRYWRLGAGGKAFRIALTGMMVAPMSIELWRLLTPPQASPRFWWGLLRKRIHG
jgi:glycosyltransferase involved in cell wall biosynthesis